MQISIIIPTLNEVANIGPLIDFLQKAPDYDQVAEIIIADGGSSDGTLSIVIEKNIRLLECAQQGRAAQMNEAAGLAKGEILYFVHADVFPPPTFVKAIQNAIQTGHRMGCFAYRFNSDSKLLQLNAFFTRFDWMANGGGDQTLFISRACFEKSGGFKTDLPIMEDFEFVWRNKKEYGFHLLPGRALVSARKYRHNSYWKVQWVNAFTFLAFRFGAAPEKLSKWYRKMLG